MTAKAEHPGRQDYHVWRSPELVEKYLEGIRGAVPLAGEQLGLMLRLVRAACPRVRSFLDLGCGDGILGGVLLEHFPRARGVFVDFSEPMLEQARAKYRAQSRRSQFVLRDYAAVDWPDDTWVDRRFDVVVSGFSIHHQPDANKRRIYRRVWDVLRPGGLFLNLEHVSSATPWSEEVFEEYFVDSLFEFSRRRRRSKSRAQVSREYYQRLDKAANLLAPVETQCHWLRRIGFDHVDCFFKTFELALFGGRRPT